MLSSTLSCVMYLSPPPDPGWWQLEVATGARMREARANLQALEALEEAHDAREFRASQATDDGGRTSLTDLREALGE